MCYQYGDVLRGSNEKILYLHSPQSSPPGSLETIACRSSKGPLREVLAGLDVSFGLSAFGIIEHSVQFVLPKMSFYGSAGLGAGTLYSELTGGTGSSGSLVLIMVPLLVVMPSFQNLACRTGKGVGMIGEGLFRENPLFSA